MHRNLPADFHFVWALTMKFTVLFKPTAMSKKAGRIRPEYLMAVEAESRDEAARIARLSAADEGFNGYAITNITEEQK